MSPKYIDKNAGWDIIHIIEKYFNQLVRDRIAAVSPFFGIMVDKTIDISTTTQLIVYIKYLGKSDDNQDGPGEYEPKSEYLDLVIPESANAINIKVIVFMQSNNFTNIIDCN